MFDILANPRFARLLGAQIIALLGTGLLTVALGLLAFELAGEGAGAVLGIAYSIKMIAYVGLSPVAAALITRLPRKAVLVGADLVRAAVALALPFVDQIWQIYLLIFILQTASATFTPAFQAIIPDLFPRESNYTKALSVSRLAYDLESLLSPALAAILLSVMSFHWLFGGTVLGFIGSAMLVLSVALPARTAEPQRRFRQRLTRGIRIYLATPRLRGLLALNFAAAAVGAFVLVNTVVMVRAGYGGSDNMLAYALMAFGGGSMVAALSLPRLLEIMPDRTLMIPAAISLSGIAIAHAIYLQLAGLLPWGVFLLIWAVSGMLYSAILTPAGRLLTRSVHSQDRPAIFTAQFALSHAGWLVTYMIAGWVGGVFGMGVTMAILGLLALAGVGLATRLWPAGSARELAHAHPDLPKDHPHLRAHSRDGKRHRHVFIIDDDHRAWPTQG